MASSAGEFDRWYADRIESPVADELVRRVLRLSPRMRRLDLGRQLPRAGFVDVEVADRPAWRRAEQALWQEALSVEAGDDPALRSMQEEAQRVLATFDGFRRVLATARAPHSA